jgi:hypothetical protein
MLIAICFRDSNMWSDVSSIGPSVSATGSVNEEELEAATNRKVRLG